MSEIHILQSANECGRLCAEELTFGKIIITDVMCSSQEMAIDIGYRAISNATFKKGGVRDSSIFFCIKVRR